MSKICSTHFLKNSVNSFYNYSQHSSAAKGSIQKLISAAQAAQQVEWPRIGRAPFGLIEKWFNEQVLKWDIASQFVINQISQWTMGNQRETYQTLEQFFGKIHVFLESISKDTDKHHKFCGPQVSFLGSNIPESK